VVALTNSIFGEIILVKFATIERNLYSLKIDSEKIVMPDKTPKPSNQKTTGTTQKKPTLTQQLKSRAEQVEQLTVTLKEQTKNTDELKKELQATKKKISVAEAATQKKAKEISLLTNAKEELMETDTEQKQLIDELTEKLLDTDIKLSSTSLQHKHVKAENIVKNHIVTGMSLGFIPIPLVDIVGLAGIQLNMLRRLCEHYEVEFDEQKSKTMVASLLSGSLPVLTMLGIGSMTKLIPGIGTLGGGLSMSLLTGSVSYATGQVFIRHFDNGGTLDDIDATYNKDFFKQKFEEGKLYVKKLTEQQKNKLSPQANKHESF